jgi:large subunit ribosomal protein L31
MKQAIHPNWNDQAVVSCACGASFTTGSTIPTIKIDICSKCHPLFTGQQKFVDTLGQVDKFQKKQELHEKKQEVRKVIIESRKAKQEAKGDKPSLKDLLMQARKDLRN